MCHSVAKKSYGRASPAKPASAGDKDGIRAICDRSAARAPPNEGVTRAVKAARWKRRVSYLGRLHHLAEHVLQDTAVAEVLELIERIDPAEQLDIVDLAGRSMDAADELAARLQTLRHAQDVVALGAVELEALPRGAARELQRQHAHAHEVRAVDALEALD